MALSTQPFEVQSDPTRYLPLMGIGRGGMGRIDLALALSIPGAEQLVVLKRLREPERQTEEERASLVWEARLSARLAHPNVCSTLGLDVLDGELVLVLEYLEGASVAALARACTAAGEPFPRRILLRIVRDTLAGLAYAHDLADYDGAPLSIVHRDISPSNVLVTTDGMAKLIDFGIAKAARSTVDTPPGFIKGKLGYMAPEQILGRAVDRRADLYAVGVLLWEGLTQHRFSAGDSIQVCLVRRLREEPPGVRDLVGDVPVDLESIVLRCLALAPDRRWPAAGALRAALEHYVSVHDEEASSEDVARFVLRHCGSALEARRAALRDRFPREARAMGVGQQLRLVPEDAPTQAALVPRRRMGKVLPALAGLAGVIASWTLDALPSARAGAPPLRSRRQGAMVFAVRAPDLVRAKAAASVTPSARERGPAKPASASALTGADERSVVVPASIPPALADDATGFVTVDAYPWARVTIDDAYRGVTPIVHLPLTAGSHVVVLESPERGRHVMRLEVRRGETVAERWLWE